MFINLEAVVIHKPTFEKVASRKGEVEKRRLASEEDQKNKELEKKVKDFEF